MPAPNNALKVEWFYMLFHQEYRTRYLESGQHLCKETLETVAKYLDNIFNLQVADSLFTKKQEKQIEFAPNVNSATKWRRATTTRFTAL